ncbi:MAG: hypothetical protein IJ933_03050 [Bacteroidales bacterium]|nr:hypothetical protein [Bacteroidales bacterium]
MATLDDIQKSLEDNRPRIYKKDYTFFNIEYIATLAKASIREGCNCRECCANTEKLALLASGYPELINSGEEGKRSLEDGMDNITKHLASEHGYARAGWYRALYSLVGMGAGLVVALIAVLLMGDRLANPKVVFLAVLFVAIFAGYVVGSRKDTTFKQNHKNL